jgi:hypothetical protein
LTQPDPREEYYPVAPDTQLVFLERSHMDKIRKWIVDLIEADGLTATTPNEKRRWLVGDLLSHFPETGKRNMRNRLNRALAHPNERRGGKREGAGAPLNNKNQNWKKRRSKHNDPSHLLRMRSIPNRHKRR